MQKLTEEQIKKLKEPLPEAAVKPHPTKTFLSSIKAIYVVERLNDVFGIGSWHLRSEVIDNKTAMIVVKSVLTIPEYGIELESYGGNDNGGENSKNHDTGDAYKGATTDALTKICSYLGIGMDVFKGITQIGGKNGTAVTKKELPELLLDSKFFFSAVAKINDGQTTLEKIKEVMRMTPKVEEALKLATTKK